MRKVAFQLFTAMAYLDRMEMIHADLKPENVLLARSDDGTSMRARIKVIDFGNAMHRSDAAMYYDDFEVQSLHYRAPEVPARVFLHAPV